MEKSTRVLAVDDEESIRNVLSMVLSSDGHEVTTASSAEEALQFFMQKPYPLVITDVRMEGMSGLQLLQEVKRINADCQVIIITSYASFESAIQALRAGAYDYIVKPFEDIDLISAAASRAVDKIRLIEENKLLVEELKRKNEELERSNMTLSELSIRDGLTGLFNHRYLQEFLHNECLRSQRHGRCFSLIFIDVDNFKKYNDTHGHPAGDKLLIALSRLIEDRLRKTDIIARYGGEEFVIILPETFKDGGVTVAENIRKAISGHPFVGRETQPLGSVTASLGVSAFPEDSKDGKTLLQLADQALYTAKNAGRNRTSACSHTDNPGEKKFIII